MKTIFIFAYYSYKDPVFQSAVLPYFENFPDKEKFRFILLTFEQDQYKVTASERAEIKDEFTQDHIIWHQTKWHSGRFKQIKKIFDFCWSLILSTILVIRYNPRFIYSEGFPGAIISHYLCKITGRKHIVHTFEPHADYMIESGVWQEKDWEAKLIKKTQLQIAQNSHAILTGTQKLIDKYEHLCPNTLFYRVPSCVDSDLFQFDPHTRKRNRSAWGISHETLLLVYLGKFGGMYWQEELFDFFDIIKATLGRPAQLLIVSKDDPSPFKHRIDDTVIWISATKKEVPGLLSSADFGICGIHNIPSRRYSSPIKNGEYWACGLPVVVPFGMSDDFLMTREKGIGIIIEDTSVSSLKKASFEIKKWISSNDSEEVRKRCRNFALEDRSVAKYKKLYLQIFNGDTPHKT